MADGLLVLQLFLPIPASGHQLPNQKSPPPPPRTSTPPLHDFSNCHFPTRCCYQEQQQQQLPERQWHSRHLHNRRGRHSHPTVSPNVTSCRISESRKGSSTTLLLHPSPSRTLSLRSSKLPTQFTKHLPRPSSESQRAGPSYPCRESSYLPSATSASCPTSTSNFSKPTDTRLRSLGAWPGFFKSWILQLR